MMPTETCPLCGLPVKTPWGIHVPDLGQNWHPICWVTKFLRRRRKP